MKIRKTFESLFIDKMVGELINSDTRLLMKDKKALEDLLIHGHKGYKYQTSTEIINSWNKTFINEL